MFSWIFGKPAKKVAVQTCYGTIIAPVKETQSGMMVYLGRIGSWLKLEGGGQVAGSQYADAWWPVSGFRIGEIIGNTRWVGDPPSTPPTASASPPDC